MQSATLTISFKDDRIGRQRRRGEGTEERLETVRTTNGSHSGCLSPAHSFRGLESKEYAVLQISQAKCHGEHAILKMYGDSQGVKFKNLVPSMHIHHLPRRVVVLIWGFMAETGSRSQGRTWLKSGNHSVQGSLPA